MQQKGPYINYKLLRKILLSTDIKKQRIKTWSRSSTIIPSMVGHTIAIHNGQFHLPVFISNLMIGHKLGEFSETKTFKMHKKVEQKKKRNVSKK